MSQGVVIAGAGQAGFQAAMSLRAEGYEEPVTLIGEEPHLPYQRPPLSKGFMAGKQDIEGTALRPGAYYKDHAIDLMVNERVAEIERSSRRVRLASGHHIPFETLVLAVGARNRTLAVPGADLEGVCYLRTIAEAVEIKQRLDHASNVVVIGGGFIGLELAASARSHGKSITVLEAQTRLMQRVVAPVISEFYRKVHSDQGVTIVLGATVAWITGTMKGGGKVHEVVLADGSIYPADLVLVGIGVLPNTDLAGDLGARTNGIMVNNYLQTEDERIYAIGDCADHPNSFAGGRIRIESVQNAVDQARCVAAAIAGRPAPYTAVPWFWTDQFDIKLQMAGLSGGSDQTVVRGDPASRKFSVFYFKSGRLTAVDSINRPGEHMAARKLIANGALLTPDQAADPGVDLKAPGMGTEAGLALVSSPVKSE